MSWESQSHPKVGSHFRTLPARLRVRHVRFDARRCRESRRFRRVSFFQGFWGSLAERERKASGGVRARLALYGFKLLTSSVLSFGLTLLDNVHLCFSAGTGNNLHIIPGGVRHSNLVFLGFFLVVVGVHASRQKTLL